MKETCEARKYEWLTQGPGMRGAGMGHGFYRVRCEKRKGHRGVHDNGYEAWPRRLTLGVAKSRVNPRIQSVAVRTR